MIPTDCQNNCYQQSVHFPIIISLHLAEIEKIAVMSDIQTSAFPSVFKVNSLSFLFTPAFLFAKQIEHVCPNQNMVKVQIIFESSLLV